MQQMLAPKTSLASGSVRSVPLRLENSVLIRMHVINCESSEIDIFHPHNVTFIIEDMQVCMATLAMLQIALCVGLFVKT